MKKKYFIFIVNDVVSSEPGQITVIGRCGDFPIRVHDNFDRAFRHKPRRHPSDSARAPIREVEKDVSLRVVCLHAYQRSLPEFGAGMTGSITLEGDGADLIAPGWILGTVDDSPRRDIHARNSADRTVSGYGIPQRGPLDAVIHDEAVPVPPVEQVGEG